MAKHPPKNQRSNLNENHVWTPQDNRGNGNPAAVLVLTVPPQTADSPATDIEQHRSSKNPNEPMLVLTRRSTRVRSHKGQISLPGGRMEPLETLATETALRETEEEIGINRDSITIHGTLPPVTALSGFKVVPVFGSCTNTDIQFSLQQDEVDRLFLIPVSYFCQSEASAFEFTLFGARKKSYLFKTPHINVWGLTAQILANLDIKALAGTV